MSQLAQDVVEAVRGALGPGSFPLHEPRFSHRESAYVQEAIDSTFVSSVGAFVDRFESELMDYTGAGYVVATVSGTAALHVALLVAGVQPNDEVLVPAMSFVATANAVRYCQAYPHFVDIDADHLGMNPVALRGLIEDGCERLDGQLMNRATGRRVTAVVPMHVFGHPCDLTGIKEVADEFGLVVVEDAAESLGSWDRGRHAGTQGTAGVLSFNGNKIITTGGGGAILTHDADLARHAKHLTTTAKLPHPWEYAHDEVGFNYRMPNLNAAMGCAQLESLPDFLVSKRRLHARYDEALSNVSGVGLLTEPVGTRSNYWLQAVILDEADMELRDEMLGSLNSAGIMARPAWQLLPTLTPFVSSPCAEVPVARDLVQRTINIPSSAGLA